MSESPVTATTTLGSMKESVWGQSWRVRAKKFCVLASLGLVPISLGCPSSQESQSQRLRQQAVKESTETNHLEEALRFVQNFSTLDRKAASREIGYQLNAWMINDRNEVHSTVAPKTIETLPAELQALPFAKTVAGREFTPIDVVHFSHSRQFAVLAKWVSERSPLDLISKKMLEVSGASLPESEKLQLEKTLKLFDWSIRNVMLEGSAKDVEVLKRDEALPLRDDALGYGRLPWQATLIGRGDAIERGRVFTELLRQEKIPSFWLALPGSSTLAPQPWAIGVLIGQEVYLFESRLGLPIPDPSTLGIATLKMVRTDPQIVRRLAVPGKFKYAVTSEQTQKLVALLDIDPAAVGGRMKRLQESLVGNSRAELWIDVDSLRDRVQKIEGISEVRWWPTSILAELYAEDLEKRLGELNEFAIAYVQQNALYMGDSPVLRAKSEHLKGVFENTLDKKGAMALYMSCRVPEETLAKMPYEKLIQEELGIVRKGGEPKEQFDARIAQFAAIYREAKVDASYLIGLLHYDLGNNESSLNWLQKRAETLSNSKRWTSGIWYGIARAEEALSKYDQAMETLRREPSPQEAGNRIRARILQQLVAPAANPESAGEPSAEPTGKS